MHEQISMFDQTDGREPETITWNLWHGCTRVSTGCKHWKSIIESVTCGGESGPEARTCDFGWVVNSHLQCVEYGVQFYYHQTGAKLIRGSKLYTIARELQHSQAQKAGLDYIPPDS